MPKPNYSNGDILVNKYGLKIRVVRMVEKGAVVVYGDVKHFDIHESLCEWGELKTFSFPTWKPKKKSKLPFAAGRGTLFALIDVFLG